MTVRCEYVSHKSSSRKKNQHDHMTVQYAQLRQRAITLLQFGLHQVSCESTMTTAISKVDHLVRLLHLKPENEVFNYSCYEKITIHTLIVRNLGKLYELCDPLM